MTKLAIDASAFGSAPNGEAVKLFTLTNELGTCVKITNFGGIITEIHVADRNGQFADVNLGFDTLEPYFEQTAYLGALIGRVGNRTAQGRFELDGQVYQLDTNNGPNHLHGGLQGFDKVVWNATTSLRSHAAVLHLSYLSVDGDQGYPGNLQVNVDYELTNSNEIRVIYKATTDKATPVNLTQHAYFNLAGKGDVLNHQMMINADRLTAIDPTSIPLGDLPLVAGTPFDFRTAKAIGKDIHVEDEQLKNGGGYDHNFVLNKSSMDEYVLAARVLEPQSGRVLEVFTSEPGVQFYSGNFLDGSLTGKGWNFVHRGGFCLEPQHFPDSPNQPQFPNIILRPGEVYTSRMSYKFSTVA